MDDRKHLVYIYLQYIIYLKRFKYSSKDAKFNLSLRARGYILACRAKAGQQYKSEKGHTQLHTIQVESQQLLYKKCRFSCSAVLQRGSPTTWAGWHLLKRKLPLFQLLGCFQTSISKSSYDNDGNDVIQYNNNNSQLAQLRIFHYQLSL